MTTRAFRRLVPALVLAAALLPAASRACPSCAATSSPKEPNVWPIVGAFMLVPWLLGGVAAVVIRRNARPA